jgi:hypothetical protein
VLVLVLVLETLVFTEEELKLDAWLVEVVLAELVKELALLVMFVVELVEFGVLFSDDVELDPLLEAEMVVVEFAALVSSLVKELADWLAVDEGLVIARLLLGNDVIVVGLLLPPPPPQPLNAKIRKLIEIRCDWVRVSKFMVPSTGWV